MKNGTKMITSRSIRRVGRRWSIPRVGDVVEGGYIQWFVGEESDAAGLRVMEKGPTVAPRNDSPKGSQKQ